MLGAFLFREIGLGHNLKKHPTDVECIGAVKGIRTPMSRLTRT